MNSTEEMTLEEKLKCSLSYDPTTGKVYWNSMFNGREALCTPDTRGYLRGQAFGHRLQAHRVAWLLYYGVWPKYNIDHVDGNIQNNKIENLRDVTQAENQRNKRLYDRNKTGVCGVWFWPERNKYIVRIAAGKKSKYVGLFKSFDEAVEARQKAEEELGYHPNHGRR
jgi:uncharacterized protein YkuJ